MRRSTNLPSAVAAIALALGSPAALTVAGTYPALAGGMYEMVRHDFAVGIDQTKMLRLEGAAAVVAVGNPSIADAIIQTSDTLLLTGRSYGATNILVFDHDGNQTASLIVNVVDLAPRLLTLNRGSAQYSYNCAPDCHPILRIGDTDEVNDTIARQTGTKMGLATDGAEATAKGSSGE